MSVVRQALLLGAITVFALSSVASAGVLVLRDGRAVRYRGELRRDDRVVVFAIEGGAVVSLRIAEVDWPASARAAALLRERSGPNEDASDGVAYAGPIAGVVSLDKLSDDQILRSLVHTGRTRPRPPVDLLLDQPDAGKMPVVVALPALTERIMPLRLLPPDPLPVPSELWRLPQLAEREQTPVIPVPHLTEPGGEEVPAIALLVPSPAPRDRSAPPRPTVPTEVSPRLERATFLSPRDGEFVYGATRIEARPRSGGAAIESIEYRVDGARVAIVASEPFGYSWLPPSMRGKHTLEASLRRVDGTIESTRAVVTSVVPDAAVDVDLVSLQVTVTNQKYLFATALEPADFQVFEDGRRVNISHFSADPIPLSLLILVDASFSMNGQKLQMARAALARLVDRLGPEDRIGVAAFAEGLRVLLPLTNDQDLARGGLDGLVADGGTAMFDAQLESLDLLKWEGGRRVILLLGDGEDYSSRVKVTDVVREAHRLDTAIYAVGTLLYRLKDGTPEHWAEKLMGNGRPRHWTDQARVRGIKFLREQTEATGGILYLPKLTGELPYVFEHVLAELKSSYSLAYYPNHRPPDDRYHTIDVYVRGSGLVARTRRGYFSNQTAEVTAGVISSGGSVAHEAAGAGRASALPK